MIYDPIKTKYTAEFLRGIAPEDLDSLLEDAKRTQFTLRTIAQSSHIEKPHLFKRTRRDIARIMTVKND